MYFQVFDYKKKYFLDLKNDSDQPICPIYSKNDVWLKYFSLSNLLYAYITRLITNHIFIGKYRLRFIPNNSFAYLCSNFPIKTRIYILYECIRSHGILSKSLLNILCSRL